jgi:hypothetical protein
MRSKTISSSHGQFVLDFEPGLTERFNSARECVAQGVYQRGLKRVAGDLNEAPGNLSVKLSDDPVRHFSLDMFEQYVEKTGDMTPIYYLVEKYLGDKSSTSNAAVEQLKALGPQFIKLLHQAGVSA